MEQMKLRVKLKDAIRSDRYLPLIVMVGIGIAIYCGTEIYEVLLYGIPALILLWIIALLIEINTTYLTISEEGLSFTSANLKECSIRWNSESGIKDQKKGKYQCKKLTDIETGKYTYIPSIIFTYPEVADFLLKNAPKGHSLLKCIK